MKAAWERVRDAIHAEWHGAAPDLTDAESELARARGREAARSYTDQKMLVALRLVQERQERTLAVDGRDLEALDGVISTLDARCST